MTLSFLVLKMSCHSCSTVSLTDLSKRRQFICCFSHIPEQALLAVFLSVMGSVPSLNHPLTLASWRPCSLQEPWYINDQLEVKECGGWDLRWAQMPLWEGKTGGWGRSHKRDSHPWWLQVCTHVLSCFCEHSWPVSWYGHVKVHQDTKGQSKHRQLLEAASLSATTLCKPPDPHTQHPAPQSS